jgi:hypothetical protein
VHIGQVSGLTDVHLNVIQLLNGDFIMSNIVQTAAASIASDPKFQLGSRLLLPCTVSRDEAKELARKLWADDSNAFAGVSSCATNDALACKVVSLALTKMVFGEHSRLDRCEKYAASLPDYKKTKAGVISGAIGKRLGILREAVSIGEALRGNILNVATVAEFNLVELFGKSPVLGGMLAPPAATKKTAEDPTVEAARKEAIAKLEAEKKAAEVAAAELAAAELAAAELAAVKISQEAWNDGLAMLGADLDNTTFDDMVEETGQVSSLETARAHRLATEKAEHELLVAKQLRREGESTIAKIHAFVDLANELGIKLSAAQIKALDALEFGAKAA